MVEDDRKGAQVTPGIARSGEGDEPQWLIGSVQIAGRCHLKDLSQFAIDGWV
jgi:hypothetical protein